VRLVVFATEFFVAGRSTMADQAPNQSANIQQSIPPTLNAGHYLVGATVGEISLVFGHTRLRPTVQDGQLKAHSLIEWLRLSP
jgi:hypothetical protein